MKTILEVTWNQVVAADEVWLRFTFENDEWYESYAKPGTAGEHRDVVLGIPENTDVTIHIVVKQGDEESLSSAYKGITGALPASMPKPTIQTYNESLASPNRYLFGSVENTPYQDGYYSGPFYLYIIDRQGRIVWYHSDIGDNPILGFPRISRDSSYIYYGNRTPWDSYGNFTPTAVKMTLDWEYQEEVTFNLWDNVDMTDDGSFIYNTLPEDWGGESYLMEKTASGTEREIWAVTDNMGDDDYSNTINWNPETDTILMSFVHQDTVVEIDRESGDGNILGNYGTGGVIKEITQDKEVVWYVKFDAAFSNDDFNKMVGHCTLIDDLYAINRGPE